MGGERLPALSELLAVAPHGRVLARPRVDGPVAGISMLASGVHPGWLYVACCTPAFDGEKLIGEALERGAPAVVVGGARRGCVTAASRTVVVDDALRFYSEASAAFFGWPSRGLTIYAITGTKGKTTTAHLLQATLSAAGHRCGCVTSICSAWPGRRFRSLSSTPEAFALHGLLRLMREDGVSHVVLEASSIGIAEERLWGLCLGGAGLTNLGTDHLQYHGGVKRYKAAKARLFREFRPPGLRRLCQRRRSVRPPAPRAP